MKTIEVVGTRDDACRRAGLSQAHISTPAVLTFHEGGRVLVVEHPTLEHAQRRPAREVIMATGNPEDRVKLGFGEDGVMRLGPEGYAYQRLPRGKVRGFSNQSKIRMLKKLGGVNAKKLGLLPLFVTLTYPSEWVDDSKEWKRQLEAFRMRVERKWGKFAIVWKLEYQKRGAPHWHMLWYKEFSSAELIILRRWLSRVWFVLVKSGDYKHLSAGTRVERLRDANGVQYYCAKYIGKVTGETPLNGRHWGVWNWSLMPVDVKRVVLIACEFYKLRRIVAGVRRSHGVKSNIRGPNHSLWAFLTEDDAAKLVGYLAQ